MKNQEFSLKFYKTMVRSVGGLFKIVYKPTVEGVENLNLDTGFILAGNHTSLLDIPLLATSVSSNIHFMGKKELYENKICNYIFRKLGSFPVDRDNADLKAIKMAIRLLKEDEILGIFPEGTRNKDAELLPFKEGTTKIAIKTKKPIIPFGISGEYKVGGGITIRFGEAIDVESLNIKNSADFLRDKVKELIKKQ